MALLAMVLAGGRPGQPQRLPQRNPRHSPTSAPTESPASAPAEGEACLAGTWRLDHLLARVVAVFGGGGGAPEGLTISSSDLAKPFHLEGKVNYADDQLILTGQFDAGKRMLPIQSVVDREQAAGYTIKAEATTFKDVERVELKAQTLVGGGRAPPGAPEQGIKRLEAATVAYSCQSDVAEFALPGFSSRSLVLSQRD